VAAAGGRVTDIHLRTRMVEAGDALGIAIAARGGHVGDCAANACAFSDEASRRR
jgi:hypothetical protein